MFFVCCVCFYTTTTIEKVEKEVGTDDSMMMIIKYFSFTKKEIHRFALLKDRFDFFLHF